MGMAKASEAQAEPPMITFIMPTRNEERFVEAAVRSLLDQSYPHDRIEVLVIDGASDDTTREIVAALASGDERVRLLDNPRRITAAAFNIGLRAASGEILSIVSAHAESAPDFAAIVADVFAQSGASLVGGRTLHRAAVDTPTARAICRASTSPFGLGGDRHHSNEQSGWIDTAYPSAYRRSLIEAVGEFDESLVRNQDDDFHLRAKQQGYPMRYDPRLRADYFARSTYRLLWTQYYAYGYWRAFTLHKHKSVASIRHLVPGMFVLGVACGPVVWWSRTLRMVWLAGVLGYAAIVAVAVARDTQRQTVRDASHFAIALVTLHTSYGTGFWRGVIALFRRGFRSGGPAT